MTMVRDGASIKKAPTMKNKKVTVQSMLEYQGALGMEEIVKNVKIPVDKIMTMSDLRIAITPALEAYDSAYKELLKRMSETVDDVEGNPSTVIPNDKAMEFNEEHKKLKDRTYELKLPTFKLEDLGFDKKRAQVNRFNIPAGFILALGDLITK